MSQTERRVEHHQRFDSAQWLTTIFEGDAVLSLPVLDCRIALSDIYADLELLEEAPESPRRVDIIHPIGASRSPSAT